MSNEDGVPDVQLRKRSNCDSNERKHLNEKAAQAECEPRPARSELRLVLLGETGSGKSATGNSILGGERFDDGVSMSSVTEECRRERATVEERELVLVDTPDFSDTDQTLRELGRGLGLCSPGPHAVLLVLPIGRFTEEHQRSLDMILEMFHEDITHHTILIFSHADKLRGEPIEKFISRQNQKVQELVERFGRRFVAFDNTNPTNREQVSRLLQRVDELLARNDNRHFTNPITEVMQKAQKIIDCKIKTEVKKRADKRWRVFMLSMKNESRKRKRIRSRIDQLEEDIEKEENVRPISNKLKLYRKYLKTELKKRIMLLEEEEERTERKKKEKEDLDIWMKEEEQRKVRDNFEWVIKLSTFMLKGVKYAPVLLRYLYGESAVEDGSSVQHLSRLLEAGKVFGAKLQATLTHCCIQ